MKKQLILITALLSASSFANDRFADTKVVSESVAGDVHILYGAGGNIGALTGPEGIMIVDSQFEPLAAKIENALKGLSDEDDDKVKYVVNTHYHGDHTGSNIYFSKSASILAHENVRKRMSVNSPSAALPVITYEDGVKVHINGERVHVKHLASGHTDSDSVVFFEKANVWHLGDLFFQARFPYVDIKGGGTVEGYLANLKTLMTKISDDAKVIPGHGKLTDKQSLQDVIDMIEATSAEVSNMKSRGLTEADIIKKGLSKKWDTWTWRFITEERWIKTLYQSL